MKLSSYSLSFQFLEHIKVPQPQIKKALEATGYWKFFLEGGFDISIVVR